MPTGSSPLERTPTAPCRRNRSAGVGQSSASSEIAYRGQSAPRAVGALSAYVFSKGHEEGVILAEHLGVRGKGFLEEAL